GPLPKPRSQTRELLIHNRPSLRRTWARHWLGWLCLVWLHRSWNCKIPPRNDWSGHFAGRNPHCLAADRKPCNRHSWTFCRDESCGARRRSLTYIFGQTVPNDFLEPIRNCHNCGASLPLGALACEQCHSLVHSEELIRISGRAKALEAEQPLLAKQEWLQ